MKKISIFLCLIIALSSILGCSAKDDKLKLVCPDGAPAISAYAIKDVSDVDVTVYPPSVASDLIRQDIRSKSADIAILPINLASKLCSNGKDYKALAVLTHGNLYGISDNGTTLDVLKGKKVGVIQLSAVPGYTVKLMLKKLGIEYTENESEHNSNNAYLFPIASDALAVKETLNKNKADLCIVAEPMCSTLLKNNPAFCQTVDVQSEYGEFPQAIMMVKTSLLSSTDKLNQIISAFDGYDYSVVNSADMVKWINDKMAQGATSSLNPVALTNQALQKSNIRFVRAVQLKEKIRSYLSSLKTFDTQLGTVAENVGDDFFWSGV